MSHSVESHLSLNVADYDRTIRSLIPGYEELLAEQLEWASLVLGSGGKAIDLGGGTGALASALAGAIPRASLEVWDIDKKMIAIAKGRLAPYGERVRVIERSFFEPLPPCRVVVASLSLHHIPERDRKRQVYANIHSALEPGGLLLNGDVTLSDEPWLSERTFDRWARFMKGNGIGEVEARAHFKNWAKEDFYRPLHEELSMLRAAGFTAPECFWKSGASTLYGGFKR